MIRQIKTSQNNGIRIRWTTIDTQENFSGNATPINVGQLRHGLNQPSEMKIISRNSVSLYRGKCMIHVSVQGTHRRTDGTGGLGIMAMFRVVAVHLT
jgi:hypothetical protein